MTIVLGAPGVDGLGGVAGVLREWQYEGAPVQLHPGDLGWFWRFGAEATAAAVRTWSRAGRILAVGLLDGPGLVRLAIAPDARQDEELARRLADDMTGRAVLPEGKAQADASMSPPGQDLPSYRDYTDVTPWPPLPSVTLYQYVLL